MIKSWRDVRDTGRVVRFVPRGQGAGGKSVIFGGSSSTNSAELQPRRAHSALRKLPQGDEPMVLAESIGGS